MIRPVLGTILSRLVVQGMNLVVVMIAGHFLGASGLGEISLLLLGITFIMLGSNVIGGGALVYLLPRFELNTLLRMAYAWAVLNAVVALAVVHFVPLVRDDLRIHVVVLALLQSIYIIHFNVLLGWQRIRTYNMISIVQAIFLVVVFYSLSQLDGATLHDYVLASYGAFGISVVISSLAVWNARTESTGRATGGAFRELARLGGQMQMANLLQLLNYRLGFYLIEYFRGLSSLGVYAVGTQLAESTWIAPKSMGTVLYTRISNSTDSEGIRLLTLTTAKAAMVVSLGLVLGLMLLPDSLFQFLFGEEITGLRPIIVALTPGIVAMAASQAFSHYFSGTGKNIHNMLGSGIGLVFTLVIGLVAVPRYGILGAALTASVAYCASVIYQYVMFIRITGSQLAELRISAADVRRVRELFRRGKDQERSTRS